MSRTPRRTLVALAALAGLLIVLMAAFQFALRRVHHHVVAALGPRASLESLSIGWTGVELRGLHVRAQAGRWPTGEELSAERIHVVPSLSSLWRTGWHLRSVTVENASLSLLRTREGRLRVLPSLFEGAGDAAVAGGSEGSAPAVRIGELRLRDAAIDFFDASVGARGAAHRIRLEAVHADVGPLMLPTLDERTAVSLQAVLRGPQRGGSLSLQGHVTLATRDADIAFKAKGLDVVALQPYLLRNNEGAVRRGALDLTLDARVKGQRLNAPGRLVLADLELASGSGVVGTFAGVPRQAVLAAMSRDGRIELGFALEGRLDDPKFSLNELFAARFAFGLAERLGVSVGGMVEGLGSVIKGLFGK